MHKGENPATQFGQPSLFEVDPGRQFANGSDAPRIGVAARIDAMRASDMDTTEGRFAAAGFDAADAVETGSAGSAL